MKNPKKIYRRINALMKQQAKLLKKYDKEKDILKKDESLLKEYQIIKVRISELLWAIEQIIRNDS